MRDSEPMSPNIGHLLNSTHIQLRIDHMENDINELWSIHVHNGIIASYKNVLMHFLFISYMVFICIAVV